MSASLEYLIISPDGNLLTESQRLELEKSAGKMSISESTFYFPPEIAYVILNTVYKNPGWAVQGVPASVALPCSLIQKSVRKELLGDGLLYSKYFVKGPYIGLVNIYATPEGETPLIQRVMKLDAYLEKAVNELLASKAVTLTYTKEQITQIQDAGFAQRKKPRKPTEGDSNLEMSDKGLSI
jgi:hypothetical protein